MRVLVIDNYDSFTYNLVQRLGEIDPAIDIRVVRNDEMTIDQLAAEARGRYVIAKLDTDKNPQTAERFRITSIPTMLIFRNGELADRLVGLQPKDAILAKLT